MKILFTGDLMPGGQFDDLIRENVYHPDWPFLKIKNILINSDLNFSNFECPIISNIINKKVREDKSSILGCSNKILPFLKTLKFEVLSLANNHINDYGEEAAINTMKELERAKIYSLGIPSTINNGKNSLIMEKMGKSLGFMAFSSDESWIKSKLTNNKDCGCVFYSRKNIKNTLQYLKPKCDFLIVSMHWGFEQHKYPSPVQIDLAHFCIDQGADIIIGHHPHIVQGYEIYKEKFIFYSLGHLFFSDFRYKNGALYKWNRNNRYGLIIELYLNDSHSFTVKIIPIYQNKNNQIVELNGEQKKNFKTSLNKLSSQIKTPKNIYRKFWINYHYELKEITYKKKIIKEMNNKGNYILILKRIIKYSYLIILFNMKKILQIQPENTKRYF